MIVHVLPDPEGAGRVLAPSDRLASGLAHGLDDRFHYLRGVAVEGQPFDAVVVGPGGTWSISLTDAEGCLAERGGRWHRWLPSSESWVPWDARPIVDARLAARRLGRLLERGGTSSVVAAGLLAWRAAVLGWGGDRDGVVVEPDTDRMAARIARDSLLTAPQVCRVVEFLERR